jgi:hypothetical protein
MRSISNEQHLAGTYQAYMVRIWRDSQHAPWRASTQCVQTGEKRLFADLHTLFAFLQAETVGAADDHLCTGMDNHPSE